MVSMFEYQVGSLISQRWAIALIGLGLVLSAFGCQDDQVELEKLNPTRGLRGAAGPPRLYPFRSADGKLPGEWEATSNPSPWAVEGGKLVGTQVRHRVLWLREPLPEYARIEFEAVATEGSAIRVEVFGDGAHRESGYVLAFGAYGDPDLHFIARLDEHGPDRVIATGGPTLEPGTIYSMVVVRTDGALRWFVNNKLLAQYIDPDPLMGDSHAYFAADGWESSVTFDNITVYPLNPTRP